MLHLRELVARLLSVDMTEVRDDTSDTEMQETVAEHVPAIGAHSAAGEDERQIRDDKTLESRPPAAAAEIQDEHKLELS